MMRLQDEAYEEIKRTVADMFVDYDIKCFPISAFEVATKIGLEIVPYSALSQEKRNGALKFSLEGFSIELFSGQWTIFYNDSVKSYGRINQTIMHEVGHYILGHTEESEEAEAEAKFFAKYALAAPPIIENLKGVKNAQNVSRSCGISMEAARNAVGYYAKWRHHFEKRGYMDYEIRILNQLEVKYCEEVVYLSVLKNEKNA